MNGVGALQCLYLNIRFFVNLVEKLLRKPNYLFVLNSRQIFIMEAPFSDWC